MYSWDCGSKWYYIKRSHRHQRQQQPLRPTSTSTYYSLRSLPVFSAIAGPRFMHELPSAPFPI